MGRKTVTKEVGSVSVDSGMLLVIDPCNLKYWNSGSHPDLSDDGYEAAIAEGRQQLFFAHGALAAVIIQNFGGDGVFPVQIEEGPPNYPCNDSCESFTVNFSDE